MKTNLSKAAAKEQVDTFFKKSDFSQEELRKTRRLAMKFKIRLGKNRQKFCKFCLSQLKGKTRITSKSKSIECSVCHKINKFKI